MNSKQVRLGWVGLWGYGLVWWWAGAAWAQQMTIGTPLHTVREGFFEHIGVQWALQGRNWSIQFGGADLAQPTIGGFQPGAGIQGGFQFGGPGWSGQLQFSAAQGNTRTVTSGTPVVTVMNGATGYVADTSLSPFVIGLIPVVGAGGLSPWVGTVPGIGVAGPQMPAWVPVPGTSKVERFLAEGGSLGSSRSGASSTSGAFRLGGTPSGSAPRPQGAAAHQAGFPAGENDLPLPIPSQMGSVFPRPGGESTGASRQTPLALGPKTLQGSGTGEDASLTQLRQAQQSTAGQAVLSVAEAKALRQAETEQANQEALQLFQRGQQAEQAGKTTLASAYYRMAAQRASGELKQQILARLAKLQSASSPK